ncbi:MAG: helix-turn-helix domain-containing protein [Proteobacteria bacterium]|nr:helix-turn-helix domain-containing protein [Pseudomonadota bacterium]
MNKKLAVLHFLTQQRQWYSAADLTRELQISAGSVSPYLIDLQQAGFVAQRNSVHGGFQYHARIKFEEPDTAPDDEQKDA